MGQGLRDHVLSTIVWRAKKSTSLQFLTNPVATVSYSGEGRNEGTALIRLSMQLPHLARWLWNGTGALATNLAEAGAFLRSDAIPGQASAVRSTNASGDTSPDLEIILGRPWHPRRARRNELTPRCAPRSTTLLCPVSQSYSTQRLRLSTDRLLFTVSHGLEKPPSTGGQDFLTLAPTVLRPYSRGQVTISSASTFDKPLIDPRYLSDERDLAVRCSAYDTISALQRSKP